MTLLDTAQLLGNFGEFFGAVAVVATLAYLALQIRQSNKIAQADAFARLIDGHVGHHRALNASPEASEAWSRGMSDYGALSDADKVRFHTTIGPIILEFQKYKRLYDLGLLPKAEFDMFEVDVVASLLTPGGKQWWEAARGKWSAVSNYLDRRIAELEGHVTPSHLDFGGTFSR